MTPDASGFPGGMGAGGGGGAWDEGIGQVRPRRVLYGPERALRSYTIEDARAAVLLRVSMVASASLAFRSPPYDSETAVISEYPPSMLVLKGCSLSMRSNGKS